MPNIIAQALDIGKDAYGRSVVMTRVHTYDGKTVWEIQSHPTSGRDHGERMSGLSDENVRQMTQALAALGRR